MTANDPRHLVRPAALSLLGVVTAAALSTTGVGTGVTAPPLDPGGIVSWWSTTGTERVVFAALHAAAVGLALWLAVTAALALMVGLRPSRWSQRLYRLVAPWVVRSALGGVVVGAAVSGPAAAAPVTGTVSEFVLADAGPAAASTFELSDQGLVDVSAPTAVDQPLPPPSDAKWTVERGDHLWHIAESTLAARDAATDPGSVGRYVDSLIEANGAIIGDDPDLIHPGDVITLPG